MRFNKVFDLINYQIKNRFFAKILEIIKLIAEDFTNK